MTDQSINEAPAPDAAASTTSGPAIRRPDTTDIDRRIAEELGVGRGSVRAAIELLDGGSTVPFIARYRKEVTGGLDDTQLRTLEERLTYLRELEDRRAVILESIREQGKLDEDLEARIVAADTKARLEDIYLPYKPKRRTKAQIAREAGHEPVADALLSDPTTDPAGYTAEQLDGARAILVERFAEDADLVGSLRETMWQHGALASKVRDGKQTDGAKFSDYFEFAEDFTSLPSHRVLAVLRGEKEDVLSLTFDPEPGDEEGERYRTMIAARFGIADLGRPADRWLADTVRWAWRTRLLVSSALDVRMRLRQAAETDAVAVFANNLRDLLLAAPAGGRVTMGLDPGFRTGTKVAVVDATGKVLAHDTIYPHQPHNRVEQALATLDRLTREHGVELVAIGNGTASRETDRLAATLVSAHPSLTKVVVSEAGASVYSASEYAAGELPDLDVTIRGAVSIARRLQDPLAELVKIDPKSIGVGQYQHDVSESLLARSLGAVVEDAVNAVGVDVNTASVPLLSRVSGITRSLAEAIVAHRDNRGAFRSRAQLTDVARLGPKAYEQCAGFMRIRGGDDPLDASAVHPEAYPVVRRIAERTGLPVAEVIGNSRVLGSVRAADFVDERFGLPTVVDILGELDKPGRDPRPQFETATFAAGVEKIGDLSPGMVLEGVVTNVAAFGAFVDVGVHQDGLVHVSAMSHSFVKDPRDVVRSGQVVKVKVTEVDTERKRIGLTLRLDDEADARPRGGRPEGGRGGRSEQGRGGRSEGQPRGGRSEGQSRGGRSEGQSRGGRSEAQSRGGRSDGRQAADANASRGRGDRTGNAGDRGRGGDQASGGDRRRKGGANERRSQPTGSMADALRRAGFGS